MTKLLESPVQRALAALATLIVRHPELCSCVLCEAWRACVYHPSMVRDGAPVYRQIHGLPFTSPICVGTPPVAGCACGFNIPTGRGHPNLTVE